MTVKVDNAALAALAGVPAQSDCGPDVWGALLDGVLRVGADTTGLVGPGIG